ncbi:alpha/beta fold hydrolase [Roseomonas sp. AR75]|uniref:alpha/beta fold hydrolase n=1 Tax=Roseomonas sp. AR75 TaxID=2562311 RepID=UPI001484EAFD|nr:alpha/beta fold hydrolase [Roseomonas sp. AR75]
MRHQPTRAEHEEGWLRSSDGIALRYVIDDFTPPWRDPETILLLHANMGSRNRFRRWVPALAGAYRVVRWDMRGHGASGLPGPDAQLSIERLTQDVVELLDHLGLARVHLAGSSTGGIIGLHAAATGPERVATLASFAALPGLVGAAGHERYLAWTERLAAEGVGKVLSETIHHRFGDDADPALLDWFIADAARNDGRFVGRLLRMLAGVDLAPLLPGIACPCLFVVPGADPEQSPEDYARLRGVPDHRFVVMPGMRHNITDAEPERCTAELLAFLRDVAARPAPLTR